MEVTRILAAKPLGSYSVAGTQMKAVAVEMLQLRCLRCPWKTLGYIEGGHFVAVDPPK